MSPDGRGFLMNSVFPQAIISEVYLRDVTLPWFLPKKLHPLFLLRRSDSDADCGALAKPSARAEAWYQILKLEGPKHWSCIYIPDMDRAASSSPSSSLDRSTRVIESWMSRSGTLNERTGGAREREVMLWCNGTYQVDDSFGAVHVTD